MNRPPSCSLCNAIAMLATITLLALATAPALVAGQGLSPSSATPEITPVQVEPVLLEIRIGDAASVVVQAQRSRDSALVPARAVCELAELRCSGVTDEYIKLDSAAAMLQAHVSLDWAQLTVLITECDSLPVMRRHARAEAHATLLARKKPEQLRPDFVARASRAWSPAVTVDYTMTAAASSISSASHAVTLATAALGGALTAEMALAPTATTEGTRTGTLKSLRPSLLGISWLEAWSSARLIRKLRLGDVPTTTTGMLRGASITNEPFAGDGSDSVNVTGTTSPSRDVDAFRDGVLLAATTASADGSYSFWLPAFHGYNSFTVTSYDSFGQERHARKSIYVPAGMLSPRAFRYRLSAGRCLSSYCSVAADVGVSYALFDRLTTTVSLVGANSAGAPAFVSATTGLVARITDALSTSLSRTGSSATSASAHFTPNPTLDVVGTYHSARPTLTQPPLHAALYGSTPYEDAAISASWRPRLRTTCIPWLQPDFAAHVSTFRSALSSTTAARLGVALPLPTMYIAPFALYTQPSNIGAPSRHTVALGIDAIISPTHVPSLTAQSIIHLNAQTRSYTRSGIATATISIPARGSLVLDAQASWSGVHPNLSLTIRQWIGGFRAMSVVNGSPAHRPSMSHTLDGSLVLDFHRPRVTTGRASMLGSARIAGVIFIDRNRNGVRDTGEEPVPGVYVRARDGGALSDSTGEYEIGDVEPFAPIILEVDPLTLPSPSLAPLHYRIRAEAVPNQLLQLDIPIVEELATAVSDTPLTPHRPRRCRAC